MNQLVATYSSTLYDISKDAGTTNRLIEELDTLTPIFNDAEVVQFFSSPMIPANQKEEALLKALGKNFDSSLIEFLKRLAKNDRLALLPQIISAYKETCVASGKGLRNGTVTSSEELSSQEKQNIQQSIEKKLGFPVSLDFKTSKDIVGGIEARIGSYIISDSLKSNLTRMNESLKRRS